MEPGTVGTTVLSGTEDGILGGGDCTMPGINSQRTTVASGKGPIGNQHSDHEISLVQSEASINIRWRDLNREATAQ